MKCDDTLYLEIEGEYHVYSAQCERAKGHQGPHRCGFVSAFSDHAKVRIEWVKRKPKPSTFDAVAYREHVMALRRIVDEGT